MAIDVQMQETYVQFKRLMQAVSAQPLPLSQLLTKELEHAYAAIDESLPLSDLAIRYQQVSKTKAQVVQSFRATFEHEHTLFKREAGRLVVLVAQSLLNTPALDPKKAHTRFGEAILVSKGSDQSGNPLSNARLTLAKGYDSSSTRCDDQLLTKHGLSDNERFDWFSMKSHGQLTYFQELPLSFLMLVDNPACVACQATFVLWYLRGLCYENDNGLVQGPLSIIQASSLADVPLETSFRAALTRLFTEPLATELIQYFSSCCKRH